ncbi:TPA: hypothetical protein L7276_004382 [Escherichia coli]|nr:hypothetical protein [Escherichia coli]
MNDSHETTAVHRNLWQESGIPPLDYCTIERASKLLNCEIDDIWHWKDRLHIDFYVYADFLDFIEADAAIHFKKDADFITDLLLMYPEEVRFTFPFLITSASNEVYIPASESGAYELFYAHKPLTVEDRDNKNVFEQIGKNSFIVRKSITCGLLRVRGSTTRHYHSQECGEPYVRLEATFDCDLYKFKMQSSQIHLSSLSDKNIYITKADLEYLHDAKVNGSFDAAKSKKRYEMAVEQELIPEIKNSNHNAERHAENREKLFKSAIYLLSKYPDECRGKKKEISPEKWRDCIVAHKDEIPPLAITNEDVILRHLRAAANGKG